MVLNADNYSFLTLGFNEPFSDYSFSNTTIKIGCLLERVVMKKLTANMKRKVV